MSLSVDNIKSNYSLDCLSLNDYERLSLVARRDYKNDLLYAVDELNFDALDTKKEIRKINAEIKLKEKLVHKYGIEKTRIWFSIAYFSNLLKAVMPYKQSDSNLSAMVFQSKLETYYKVKTSELQLLLDHLGLTKEQFLTNSFNFDKINELRNNIKKTLLAKKELFINTNNTPDQSYIYQNGRNRLGALNKELETYKSLKTERLTYYKSLPKPKFKRDKKLTFFSWLWLTIKDYFHLFFWKQRNFFGKIKDKIISCLKDNYHQSSLNASVECNKACKLAVIEEYLISKDPTYVRGSFIDFDATRVEVEKDLELHTGLFKTKQQANVEDTETIELESKVTYFKNVLAQLPPTRKKIERREKVALFFKRWGQALLYVGPVLVLLGIFSFYPIVNAFRLSFLTGYNHADGTYEKLSIYKNFSDVLLTGNFIKPQPGTPASALINTFIITFISVPISIMLALGIAAALSSIKAFKSAFQTIFFLPYITNSLAIGLVFAYIFQDKGGLFNKFLNVFGIEGGAWISVGANYYKSMFVLIVFSVWHGLAFKIMVFLSAIESIDKQYYQAAQIDKTSKFRQFRRITMPLISPTVFYIVITSLIGSLKTYTSVIAIFGVEGKPAGAPYNLKTVVFFIYDFFKTPDLFPMASAGSIILFLIILLFTIVQIQVSKRRVHY